MGKVIRRGTKCGRLFPLYILTITRNKTLFSFLCTSVLNDECRSWHKRIGHPNSQKLSQLLNSGLLFNKNDGSFHDIELDCSSCKLGTSKTLPFPSHNEIKTLLFPSHNEIKTQCFDLIHTDVWGIAPIIAHSNYKYLVTFIGDSSRFTWVYFLHNKTCRRRLPLHLRSI